MRRDRRTRGENLSVGVADVFVDLGTWWGASAALRGAGIRLAGRGTKGGTSMPLEAHLEPTRASLKAWVNPKVI